MKQNSFKIEILAQSEMKNWSSCNYEVVAYVKNENNVIVGFIDNYLQLGFKANAYPVGSTSMEWYATLEEAYEAGLEQGLFSSVHATYSPVAPIAPKTRVSIAVMTERDCARDDEGEEPGAGRIWGAFIHRDISYKRAEEIYQEERDNLVEKGYVLFCIYRLNSLDCIETLSI